MTLEQIARLYVIFKTLQPEIKEWIASDGTSAIIKAIAARFILSDEQERVLPLLVLRLVTQDLPPESFKAELAKEMNVDADLAKSITEAIAKEVIEPIAAALRYGGVNTALLGFNAPPTSPSGLRGTSATTPHAAPEPQLQAATEAPTETITTPAPVTMQPFILHEEPRAAAAQSGVRSFSYSPQTDAAMESAASPRVVIERVVHYSQLRTPLNIAGATRNVPEGDRARPKLPQSKWFA